MKTIVYMGFDLPDGNASSLRVFYNALALKEHGYKVILLNYTHNENDLHAGKSLIAEMDIWNVSAPQSAKSWMEYLISIRPYQELTEKIGHIDAIITYDQPGISFKRLKSYCQKHQIKLIFDCAEWHSTIHLRGIKRLIKVVDVEYAMRYAYKKADGIIAISSYLKKYYSRTNKVLVLPPLQSKHQTIQKQKNKITRFIYAGAVGKDKDRLDIIIKSMRKISNPFIFNVFGLTEDDFLEQYPELELTVEKIKKNAELIFHGRVPHHKVEEYLSTSDFTLLIRNHSRKNDAGFPTKFIESINFGVPVISTEFSNVMDYVVQYNLGIRVENPNNIDSALLQAIKMTKEEYQILQEACNQCGVFDYRNNIDKLGRFVDQICEDAK